MRISTPDWHLELKGAIAPEDVLAASTMGAARSALRGTAPTFESSQIAKDFDVSRGQVWLVAQEPGRGQVWLVAQEPGRGLDRESFHERSKHYLIPYA